MTEYLILSKYYSSETPAYALVDDAKFPNQVVCYTVPQVDYKGHWKVIPERPGSNFCFLELAEQRRAERDEKTEDVMVGNSGVVWAISPPLTEGGPDTPRTIATAINTRLHVSEWTIHGIPKHEEVPDSWVRVDTRIFSADINPKSLWYFQEIPKA